MSEANSPMYARGEDDGRADRARVEHCPPLVPYGPTPPNLAYPVMYERGYWAEFGQAVAHVCTEKCERR
jgi:hypothetical protein